MHSITLALLMLSPAEAAALQRPPAVESPYGLMTEREWVSAMSHFVFGADPRPESAGDAAALVKYLERERQKDEKKRLAAQNKKTAKAILQQLIAEHESQLAPAVRDHLPPQEVTQLVRELVMLRQVLTGLEAAK